MPDGGGGHRRYHPRLARGHAAWASASVWSGIIDMLAGNSFMPGIEVPLVKEEMKDGALWVTLDVSAQELEFNDVKIHDMTVESKLVDIIRPSTLGGYDVGVRFSGE